MAFQYVHGDDDLVRLPGVTCTGTTENATYPGSNLINGIPGKPGKLTGTTGNWVVDLGSAKTVQVVAIVHHNLDAGLSVNIQGNATNSWGAPSFSQAITIPSSRGDGFSVNPFLSISQTYRYWRLVIASANSVLPAVGELVLGGTLRTLARGISPGAVRTERRLVMEQKTSLGASLRYDLGVIEREIQAETVASLTGLAALRAWWQSCKGRLTPTLIIPDNSANDCTYALFSESVLEWTWAAPNGQTVPLNFSEVSRGLAL
jgi:hypothetical protein